MLVLWAEQDVIVADEFRDGNVPAGMGNLRIIQKAVAALPGKFDEIRLRGDSALYEHDAMTWMDENRIRYAISVRMSQQIKECIEALPENHWKPAGEETDAIREWAEINYVPSDGNWSKEFATPRRYLAIRIKPKQGELLGDGSSISHFADRHQPQRSRGRHGLDLIRWHRQKAGTIEHTHDVLMNELAGWCLPSQKFGANAAWLRMNVLLYNLLSAFKRVGLPEEMHDARPKRLRFLVLNTVGKVVRHARETLLRCADAVSLGPSPTRPGWHSACFGPLSRGMRSHSVSCLRVRITNLCEWLSCSASGQWQIGGTCFWRIAGGRS